MPEGRDTFYRRLGEKWHFSRLKDDKGASKAESWGKTF